jgi:hypothetical protein
MCGGRAVGGAAGGTYDLRGNLRNTGHLIEPKSLPAFADRDTDY